MPQRRLTIDDVTAIVARCRFLDRRFRVLEKGDGYLLQMMYLEPDVERPESDPVEQSSRKWYISPYMTPSEIVETVWACVCRSQIHIASEHFTFNGERVYSQHFAISGRIALCREKNFDVREPKPTKK